MNTKRLFNKHSILLMLHNVDQTTTILFNHRGQVTEIKEYMHMQSSDAKEISTSVLCDDEGQVYRVCLLTPTNECAQQSSVDEEINCRLEQNLKKSHSLYDIKIALAKNQNQISRFIICGHHLCWLREGFSEDETTQKKTTLRYIDLKYFKDRSNSWFVGQIKLEANMKYELDLEKFMGEEDNNGLDICEAPASTFLSLRS